MDMNEFSPAGPSGLGRDELAEAIDRMSRERQPSTSKMAATFSTPQTYQLDQLHEEAKGGRPAMPAQQFERPQSRPWEQARGGSTQTVLGAIGDVVKGRMEADSQEYARQEREDRIRQQRQGRQQPQPQEAQPEAQAQPQRGPQDVSIGNRPAQAPWGRPATVSTTPQPGSPVGDQFRDIVPAGYPGNGQTFGRDPYASVNDRIADYGRTAGSDLLRAQRQRETLAKTGGSWSVPSAPAPGTVLGGQFPQGGKGGVQQSRPDLGWQVEHSVADSMSEPTVRRAAEDLPEAL